MLPSGWEEKTLENTATLQRGFDLPLQERHDGDVPVYGSNGIDGYHVYSRLCGPGVITGRSGSIGFVYYSEGTYWPLNTTLYVKNFHGNDPKFIKLLLESIDLKKFVASTGVPSLNRNFVHPELVNVPPTTEQRAIARVLDKVDEAMEATSAMLAKQEKIKQGLLQDLLNPMGKTLVPLSSALSGIRGGGTPSKAVASYWSGNIPWASVKDFSENSMYIYATEDMISEAGLHDSASSLIPEKTPLICTRMAVGRSSLTTVPTAINQDVKALFLKDKISAEYIVRHLHYLQSKLEAIAVGSTVKGITLKDLSNLQIYLPDYDRQVEIANILEVVDDNCTLYKDELTKLRALKAGLMQDLLTGKKRVTPALMQQIQQAA